MNPMTSSTELLTTIIASVCAGGIPKFSVYPTKTISRAKNGHCQTKNRRQVRATTATRAAIKAVETTTISTIRADCPFIAHTAINSVGNEYRSAANTKQIRLVAARVGDNLVNSGSAG
jgi:hypothetical protein